MPNYKGHLVGGTIAFLLLVVCTLLLYKFHAHTLPEYALYLMSALAGSLFPDIDTKSKGQRLFSIMLLPIVIGSIALQYWLILAGCTLTLLIPLLSYHRGITHQVWFIISLPLVVPLSIRSILPSHTHHAFIAYAFFVAGALSHVILDFGMRNFLRRGLFGWPKKRKNRW